MKLLVSACLLGIGCKIFRRRQPLPGVADRIGGRRPFGRAGLPGGVRRFAHAPSPCRTVRGIAL